MILPSLAFHLADDRNLAAILRNGLQCTASLIRQSGGDPSDPVFAARTGELELGDGVVLRDQRPIPRPALQRCLDADIDPGAWYSLLAGHVFFWLDAGRMKRHLAAQKHSTTLLVYDAHALVKGHERLAYVTPFNIGSAKRKAAKRGHRTLVPLSDWRRTGWTHETLPGAAPRSQAAPPAELLIRGDAPWAGKALLAREPVTPDTVDALLARFGKPAS